MKDDVILHRIKRREKIWESKKRARVRKEKECAFFSSENWDSSDWFSPACSLFSVAKWSDQWCKVVWECWMVVKEKDERRWKRKKREIPSYSLKVLLLLQIPFSFLSFKQWVSALTQLRRALIPSFFSHFSLVLSLISLRSFSASPRKTRNKTFLLDNILLFSHLLIFFLSILSYSFFPKFSLSCFFVYNLFGNHHCKCRILSRGGRA